MSMGGMRVQVDRRSRGDWRHRIGVVCKLMCQKHINPCLVLGLSGLGLSTETSFQYDNKRKWRYLFNLYWVIRASVVISLGFWPSEYGVWLLWSI